MLINLTQEIFVAHSAIPLPNAIKPTIFKRRNISIISFLKHPSVLFWPCDENYNSSLDLYLDYIYIVYPGQGHFTDKYLKSGCGNALLQEIWSENP